MSTWGSGQHVTLPLLSSVDVKCTLHSGAVHACATTWQLLLEEMIGQFALAPPPPLMTNVDAQWGK
jgi:hypothetical protein